MKDELQKFKYHPRIMELRLALIKGQIDRQYGEDTSIMLLKMMSDMFQCNWSLLLGVFNKDYKILTYPSVTTKRKKQEIIFMGCLYGETRYYISDHYLNMSSNYLYQTKGEHNSDIFANEEWTSKLDDEIMSCGVRAYALEAKRFLVAFDNFVGIFK